jgi:hypothetical protein
MIVTYTDCKCVILRWFYLMQNRNAMPTLTVAVLEFVIQFSTVTADKQYPTDSNHNEKLRLQITLYKQLDVFTECAMVTR